MFPNGLPPLDGTNFMDQRVTTSVPTSPRLKTVLTENLCIEKWVANLERMEAPGHIPWVGDQQPLLDDGFEHPSENLKDYSAPRNLPTRQVSHLQSFRDALVFEREITLKTDGRTKRWSLHVPATTMKPEMVDMMLELQGLNSFFREGLQDLDNSVAALHQEKDKFDLPSLTISNSHSTVPLLLGASGDVISELPLSLAARRGKRCLPALSVKQTPGEIMYPGFPTAFLGSPSTYSPKFEFANNNGDTTLDLQDMIANLRSQTAYIPPRSLPLSTGPPMAPRIPNASTLSTTSLPGEVTIDDEWEFASSLLADYGSQPNMDTVWTPDLPAGLYLQSNTSEPSINHEVTQGPSDKPASDPPSSPLPAQPATPLDESRVRSILKPHKSVRFASLPNRKQADVLIAPMASSRSSRHSTGSSKKPPVRSPSPLRNTFSSQDTVRPVLMQRTHIVAQSSQQPKPTKSAKTAPLSPQRTLEPATPRSSPNDPQTKAAPPPQNVAVPQKKPSLVGPATKASGLSRHSFGRVMMKSTPNGKENKHESLSSRSPGENRTWYGIDKESPVTPQRSKMPVPLRNIFTRFK
ncbi:hypothetical protein BD779DRAFT_1670494 [Infundibulicybe gibba]|nr:hypothetical protein BD779DRAFT_1670494 [Infundibulicybe gibba]